MSRPSLTPTTAIHDEQSKFRPPTTVVRAGSVRIVSAGVDEPEHRPTGETAKSLANVATDVLNDHGYIRTIEQLIWSGPRHDEFILTPMVGHENRTARGEPVPAAVRTAADIEVTGKLKRARDALAEAVADALPDTWGVETCAVDLGDLADRQMPTTRLVTKDKQYIPESNVGAASAPTVSLVRDLHRLGQPFMLQMLVRRNTGKGGDYQLTQRLTVFDPAQLLVTRDDAVALLEEGHAYDIGQHWRYSGVTSTAQLIPADFVEKHYGVYRLKGPKHQDLSRAKTLWLQYAGLQEYEDLLAARMSTYDIQQKLLGYGRMVTTDAVLPQFFVIYPAFYDESPWASVPGWDPPRIITQSIYRLATGTEQAKGTDGYVDDPTPRTGVATEGGADHQSDLVFAITVLTQEGRPARIVDQTSETLPDGIVAPAANLVDDPDDLDTLETLDNLEIEHGDVDKPGRIGVNKARAIYQDRDVLFVTEDKAAAKRVYKFLKHPIKEIHDDGAVLYTSTKTLIFDDGSIPLLPLGVSEATWVLTPDGEQRLYANDQVIAAGDAEVSAETYTYDTPRLIDTGTEYRVEAPDGTTLTTATEKGDILEDWTQVNLPHVPMRRHYLDGSEIRYQNGNQLIPYEPVPSWSEADGVEAHLSGVIREFNTGFTMTGEDARMRYDAYREAVHDYRMARLGVTDPAEIAAQRPASSVFGRGKPAHMETDTDEDEDGVTHSYVINRTIAYPDGLLDPDLPFVEPDDQDESPRARTEETPDDGVEVESA